MPETLWGKTEMKQEKTSVWVHLIWAITTVISLFIIFSSLAWMNTPATWTFRIEMDNNTLEAIQSLNETTSQIREQECFNPSITGYCPPQQPNIYYWNDKNLSKNYWDKYWDNAFNDSFYRPNPNIVWVQMPNTKMPKQDCISVGMKKE